MDRMLDGLNHRRSLRASTLALLIPALWILSSALGASGQELPDPEALGPYPVGVTTIQLDDHGRVDPETGGPRQLLTEIYYPAAEEARSLPKSKFSEFIPRGGAPGFVEAAEEALSGYRDGFTLEAFDKEYRNVAVRDARVREGKWPLIVFSHGSGGTRFGYTYFVEHMTSHGFIVMSADHTGNARVTFLDGKVVVAGGDRRSASAADRPRDVSFLIDVMTKMNNGADSRFAGRVDIENVGVSGMSFGGSTTMRALEQDERIKAGVMLAPGGSGGERTNLTTPIMMMIGTEDSTVGERGNTRSRAYYEASEGPRYLVEIKDAGHFTFTSVEQYNPEYGNGIGSGERITVPGEAITYLSMEESHKIINAYAVAFWSVYLRGQDGYKAFLSKNQYGEKIIFKN